MALDSGGKGEHYMKKKKTKKVDLDKPFGRLRPVADFLPPPEDLVPHETTAKITISLDANTIEYFKKVADRNGVKYQRMIREVLKGYADKYK